MSTSSANAGLNLAELTADARALIEADKKACWIRWKCHGLPEKEKQRLGPQLLAAVPESARPAVVAALKARGSR